MKVYAVMIDNQYLIEESDQLAIFVEKDVAQELCDEQNDAFPKKNFIVKEIEL